MRLIRFTNHGLGLIEVLIAMAVVLGLALASSQFISFYKTGPRPLSDKLTCQDILGQLLTTIKDQDNSLQVDNWLPTRDSRRPSGHTLDFAPYGTGVTPLRLFNSQNVRGAATWAQNVYNQNRAVAGRAICNGTGLTYTGDIQLNSFMTLIGANFELPPTVQSVNLKMNPKGVPCGAQSEMNGRSNFGIVVQLAVEVLNPSGERTTCAQQINVSYGGDSYSATVTTGNVTNGLGQIIDQTQPDNFRCTCREPAPGAGCVGDPNAFTMQFDVTSSEPGSMFLCRRVTPVADPNFQVCSDIPGLSAILLNDESNVPTQGRVRWSGLSEGQRYEVQVATVDVGGNITTGLTYSAWARRAQCPSPQSYCPQATETGSGIMFRPRDDCNIERCPVGQRRAQGCANPDTVCAGRPINDDCGNPTCPVGRMPGSGCRDPDTFCGAPNPARDSCNGLCPAGRACSTPPPAAATPPPTAMPSPPPACIDPCPASFTSTFCDTENRPSPDRACAPLTCRGTQVCATPTPAATPTPTPSDTIGVGCCRCTINSDSSAFVTITYRSSDDYNSDGMCMEACENAYGTGSDVVSSADGPGGPPVPGPISCP